jgi:parallel beta-helix repeat protein
LLCLGALLIAASASTTFESSSSAPTASSPTTSSPPASSDDGEQWDGDGGQWDDDDDGSWDGDDDGPGDRDGDHGGPGAGDGGSQAPQQGTVAPDPVPPPGEPPSPAPEAGSASVPESSGPSVPATSGTCDLRRGPVPSSSGRTLQQVPSAASRVAYPCPYPEEWHGIRLSPTSIRLVVGGQLTRQIPFAAEGRAVGLDEITEAIGDPSWIEEVEPGVFVLRATLVQSAGTNLAVHAPRVTTVRLADRPGVALTGSRATASFDGVTVTSWNEWSESADTDSDKERPYVVYQNASTFNVNNSTFEHLGSDRTSSYGVSWRRAGTTGQVTNSVFQHNFFGIYTYEAANMNIAGNTVRYNERYGIDPHDASSGLVVQGNDVYANGSHGIIFSRYVHNSVVLDNYVHDNAGNGIMMDFHSDQNAIQDNIVTGNGREGIVSSASAEVAIRNNRISDSEVGVRVSNAGADRVIVERNFIGAVETGIKIYDTPIAPFVSQNLVHHASVAGMRVDSPGATLDQNLIYATPVGYDARTAVTITGGRVIADERALDVGPYGEVALSNAELVGGDVGIRVARGGDVTRHATDVTVREPDADGGSSTGRALSLIGVGLVAAAVGLQGMHAYRNRQWSRHVPAPAHVRNLS